MLQALASGSGSRRQPYGGEPVPVQLAKVRADLLALRAFTEQVRVGGSVGRVMVVRGGCGR